MRLPAERSIALHVDPVIAGRRLDTPDALAYARFVRVLMVLNANYFVGNLLLTPVKIAQYAYEQLLSFDCITVRSF